MSSSLSPQSHYADSIGMEKPQSFLHWNEESRGPWMVQPLSQACSSHINQNLSDSRLTCGLEMWDSMKTIWTGGGLEELLFRSLSVAEVNSFRILLEWWEGKIQKSSPSERARERLEEFSNIHDIGASERPPLAVYYIGDVSGSSTEHNENCKSAKYVGSNYNEQLFELFQLEFCGLNPGESPKTFWLMMHNQRQKCAELAACQRLAHSLCCSIISENLVGDEDHTSKNISTSNHISASIHPCPWLSPRTEKDTQLPRYLWDVASMRTVHVKDLAGIPQYVTISHTWGRWRDDSQDKPAIRFQGVDWDIPRNTRFPVENLPQELKKLPLSYPYVWLDLLCIPQDNRLEAQEEIARQAAIFTGAASSIIWFNEIETWERTENHIQFYAYQYLRMANLDTCVLEDTVMNDKLEEATEASHQHTELWIEADGKPLGWFTSLWTLQEACLRPDMFICNKSWELLTLNRAVPVSFDAIIAISQLVITFHGHSIKEFPLGPRVLYGVLVLTGMSLLLGMSQQEVLALGNGRICTGSRAEAIMSVLGTTDWYENRLSQHGASQQDEELVLMKYPLSFVKEVKEKVGALFFNAHPREPILKLMKKQELGSTEAWGTLLPFHEAVEGRPKYSSILDLLYTDEDPTVKCWTVESNGSITITKAAILASSNNDSKDFCAAIYGPDVPQPFQENRSFREFCEAVEPDLPKYAIQIAKGPQGNILGIILMQIHPEEDNFVKISGFGIKSGNYQGSTKVLDCEWHVL